MPEFLTGTSESNRQAAPNAPHFKRILRSIRLVPLLLALLVLGSPSALAQRHPPESNAALPTADTGAPLPDVPPAPQQDQSKSFVSSLGTAVKTIGQDELHIIKAPFSLNSKTMMWNALAVGATGVLIANDESVAHQVSPGWHTTSINISNATLGGLGATAGGIFVTGLVTHNDDAIETGIRSAEASVDSVILYAALKAILARQRPYTGAGEGKFFSGNWTAGSFPSGHSTLAWTLATVVAREYPNWPVRVLMYSAALAVSTTRVTGGVHFPADVFSGAVIGFGVGTFVSNKDRQNLMVPRAQNRIKHLPNAILQHVAIGAQ
jgi:membrane-associated phospholipid phosphatase